MQMPSIEAPDGTWLTDSTLIMDHFERADVGPRIRPEDAATAFCSLLLEDLFDEWYWRPALYYRWAFEEDAKLMSRQIARTLLRDSRQPLFLRQRFILRRQRTVYLKKDGVTKETAPAIEALYMDSLRELEIVFSRRPYLFGERPCEADFGLFAPFFRHFFCDPTAGALMREHAPQVTHWVTRLWQARPSDLEDTPPNSFVPEDLGFFFEMAASDYFPYLEANAQSFVAGEKDVRYSGQGAGWCVPTAPYRVQCFNDLKTKFSALESEAADHVAKFLPPEGIKLLQGATTPVEHPAKKQGLSGRLWRRSSMYD
jgi:glutathione S-transferase